MQSLFKENDAVGAYIVQREIKSNSYTQTYRVVDKDEHPFFLKVYILKCVPEKVLDKETRKVRELEVLEKVKHSNLPVLQDSGTLDTEVGEVQYMVTSYFTGDVLSDILAREGKMPVEDALGIYKDILNGLKHLHGNGYCHNDITPCNVMLTDKAQKVAEIIDMGHASAPCSGIIPFDTSDLDVNYCANSCFAGVFSEQSDLFSATAVLYTLLTGELPWQVDIPRDAAFSQKMRKVKQFRKGNELDLSKLPVEDYLKEVIRKGLCLTDDHYSEAEEILEDLASEKNEPSGETSSKQENSKHRHRTREEGRHEPRQASRIEVKKGGNGFADIAGMNELKETLQKKVIFILKDKETAEKYRLTPPNGLLLYGPPGCGKSFFAEKFAEETDFNYILIKSSDLASPYVHGSQEKIGELFKEAEKNAPTVICFDEFDALVPNRSGITNASEAGEVNEFLSQLNNCSQRGIFVIATTNRPDRIDPAVLRTGRLDKIVYVPMPDLEARKEMFRIHLLGRPFNESEIDLEKLSKDTEGYIASDIAYIVNDAAMLAAFTHSDITQELLEQTIQNTRPSIRSEVSEVYENIREQMEGQSRRNSGSNPIGFRLK